MAQLYVDNHMQYYHIDAVISIQFGHSYFASPDYLAVRVLISIMIQLPDHVTLTGLYKYTIFPREVGHTLARIVCHDIGMCSIYLTML